MDRDMKVENIEPSTPVVEGDKMSKKSIIGMTILTVVALAGVAFGVWGISEKNRAENDLAVKITEATGKVTDFVTDKITSVSEDGTVTEIMDAVAGKSYRNPIIESNDSKYGYSENLTSTNVYVGHTDPYTLWIRIKNGIVSHCDVTAADGSNSEDCQITGLTDSVYKVIEFGKGQDNGNNYIGFILTDGTVAYIPLYEAVENKDFAIRGTLDIDGYVTDAVEVSVSPEYGAIGGYGSTVFVLSDGTYVEFDESMLN